MSLMGLADGGGIGGASGLDVGSLQEKASALLRAGQNMSASQLAAVIAGLSRQLHEKEGGEQRLHTDLLRSFLRRSRNDKQRQLEALQAELSMLDADEAAIAGQGVDHSRKRSGGTSASRLGDSDSVPSSATGGSGVNARIFKRKRRRMGAHHDVLYRLYQDRVARSSGSRRVQMLGQFTTDIDKLTRYSSLQSRATLMHVARLPETAAAVDVFKPSNIVSSIEFDRDSEFVATAGVTKRIKIFEFANITANLTDVHFPIREIPTQAKLSWVCWNPYIRHHLVSSDYEGFVTLWDVNRGASLREYEEHENRAWSVDYCPAKPTYFASGSDDGRVKLWTTSQRASVLTIDNKPANVCSVKFHPTQAEKLAFGSVDYNVHYYDLRNTKQALQVFKSHTKAVSYVKFMSPSQLVSASVDSTVKLWNLGSMSLERTFTGHVNDKNFVGLSVTEDYIACGSERNAVYCYYKSIPKPFTGYRFSSVDPLTGQETHDDDDSQFVSSVCWCPNNPTMLVAANSLGSMKVLQLDSGDEEDDQDDEQRAEDAESQVERKPERVRNEVKEEASAV